jgi:hypothetical protein
VSDSGRADHVQDITEKSGLCIAATVWAWQLSYDNDGFPDVFITRFAAPNQLFHNNGDGTFTDYGEGRGRRKRTVGRERRF